jgi:hypothetical protein
MFICFLGLTSQSVSLLTLDSFCCWQLAWTVFDILIAVFASCHSPIGATAPPLFMHFVAVFFLCCRLVSNHPIKLFTTVPLLLATLQTLVSAFWLTKIKIQLHRHEVHGISYEARIQCYKMHQWAFGILQIFPDTLGTPAEGGDRKAKGGEESMDGLYQLHPLSDRQQYHCVCMRVCVCVVWSFAYVIVAIPTVSVHV